MFELRSRFADAGEYPFLIGSSQKRARLEVVHELQGGCCEYVLGVLLPIPADPPEGVRLDSLQAGDRLHQRPQASMP